MSEMVERVVRAIALADLDEETQAAVDIDKHMQFVAAHYEELARAAIAAMEEPTEEMLREGQRAMIAADLEWRANACYQAAIRAALST